MGYGSLNLPTPKEGPVLLFTPNDTSPYYYIVCGNCGRELPPVKRSVTKGYRTDAGRVEVNVVKCPYCDCYMDVGRKELDAYFDYTAHVKKEKDARKKVHLTSLWERQVMEIVYNIWPYPEDKKRFMADIRPIVDGGNLLIPLPRTTVNMTELARFAEMMGLTKKDNLLGWKRIVPGKVNVMANAMFNPHLMTISIKLEDLETDPTKMALYHNPEIPGDGMDDGEIVKETKHFR